MEAPMSEKKKPEDVAQTMESFEATELDDAALDVVAGGQVALEEGDGGTNGNCSCPPGSNVPDGDWTNGNCPAP